MTIKSVHHGREHRDHLPLVRIADRGRPHDRRDPPPQKERIEVRPLARGDGREPRLAEERAGQEIRQEYGEPEGPRPHPRGALQGGAEEGGVHGREVRESDGHGLMAFDPDAAAAEGSGIYGLPHTPAEARVVIIPVPFEATTSYGGGTAGGPRAILEASKQVDLYDRETGHPYEAGIAMLDEDPRVVQWNAEAKRIAQSVIARGGAVDDETRRAAAEVDEFGERLNAWVYEQTRALLDAGKIAVTH